MEPFKTHGAVSWSELVTPDPGKSADYYGALFGWTFDTMDMGSGPYRVVKVGDAAIGGIMAPPPGMPIPPNWCPYVTVDNVDATVANCQSLGGSVVVPVMEIPTVGRMAVLKDPQGAVINVIQYVMA